MTEAEKQLDRARRWMEIMALAKKWSSELGISQRSLIKDIGSAILNGELDKVPATGGVVRGWGVHDLETGQVSPASSTRLRRANKPGTDLSTLVSTESVVVMREAALAFASARGIRPPSFWPQRARTSPSKFSEQKLRSALLAVADGQRKKAEVKGEVEKRLGTPVPKHKFESAWLSLPADRRRPQGSNT